MDSFFNVEEHFDVSTIIDCAQFYGLAGLY